MVLSSQGLLALAYVLLLRISRVAACDFPPGRWQNVESWNAPAHTNCHLQTYDAKTTYSKNITKEELALGIQNLTRTTECVTTSADATMLCMFEHFPQQAPGERTAKPVFINYYATQINADVHIRFVSACTTIVNRFHHTIDIMLTRFKVTRIGPQDHDCSNKFTGKPPVVKTAQVFKVPTNTLLLGSPAPVGPWKNGTTSATLD